MRQGYVYIVTNKPRGTLYIGVTANLGKRIWEHKNHFVKGFSYKYNLDHLVWFEAHETIYSAISKEKQLKNWKRGWKVALVEGVNPEWRDLYWELVERCPGLDPGPR